MLLRRSYTPLQWLSIAVVTCGLLTAASAAFGRGAAAPTLRGGWALLGSTLSLLSPLLAALRAVAEEWLLQPLAANSHRPVHYLYLVGLEGAFGAALCACALLPAAQFLPGTDCGSLENTNDTLAMLSGSYEITLYCLAFIGCVPLFSGAAAALTAANSATFRELARQLRALTVWVAAIATYYKAKGAQQRAGVPLDAFSAAELSGFLLLALGVAGFVYAENAPNAQPRAQTDAAVAPEDDAAEGVAPHAHIPRVVSDPVLDNDEQPPEL
jgi:hypothetical protein